MASLVGIIWFATTTPAAFALLVFYWRRLVATPWLPPPQPPIFSRRPPFLASPRASHDRALTLSLRAELRSLLPTAADAAMGAKWRRKWLVTGVAITFAVLALSSSGLATRLRHDDSGLEPSYWVMLWYNVLGTLIIVPYSESLTDAATGIAHLVARQRGLPLPNSRKNWLQERWCCAVGIWALCALAAVDEAYYWGDQNAPLVTVEVPLARLPRCLDGVKVFLIADTHAGPLISQSAISDMVELVNAQQPPIEIVLHAGDGGGAPHLPRLLTRAATGSGR